MQGTPRPPKRSNMANITSQCFELLRGLGVQKFMNLGFRDFWVWGLGLGFRGGLGIWGSGARSLGSVALVLGVLGFRV